MPRRLDLALRNTDRVYPLQPGQTLTAGRTSQCEIQIDDPSVSRRHCTIALLANGLLQIKDLDSANGTFVNERPVKDATARPGDLILVAGKGHEKTQAIGDRVLPFDDVEVARSALSRRRSAGTRAS